MPSAEDINCCMGGLETRVSNSMNSRLNRTTPRKKWKRCWNKRALKPPSPYGFSAGFYQAHWSTLGVKVSVAVLSILQGPIMIYSLNSTFIALILKINSPTLVSEFQPISLCDVVYKLVFKVITNRLKHVMSFLISWNQSTFILGRLIIDNILLAHELLHSMKGLRHKGVEMMAVKLDMSKAYDRVEWVYLWAIMLILGFWQSWIKLVMSCVTLVQYSIWWMWSRGKPLYPLKGWDKGIIYPFTFSFFVRKTLARWSTKRSWEEHKAYFICWLLCFVLWRY